MPAAIPAELQDALHRYCASDPEKFGLYLAFCNAAGGGPSVLRSVLGLLRHEVVSRVPLIRPGHGRLGVARVLFQAAPGDRHTGLWVPLALGLMERRIEVGLAFPERTLPADVLAQFPSTGGPEKLIVPEGASADWHERPEAFPPLRGIARLNARMYLRYASRMREAWRETLYGSPVTTVVTTSPASPWSAAMVQAANDLGLKTVFLMQGFPSAVWGFPSCGTAVTWSPLGEQILRKQGWREREIIVARRPGSPDQKERARLRQQGRTRLGICHDSRVVLFLGQKSQDQTFAIDGYLETCKFIGGALSEMVGRGCHAVLRPHYGEGTGETEAVIRGAGVSSLIVTRGTSLWEDVLAADVVVSVHSAALEEAWIAGAPVVQAVCPGVVPGLDFTVLGAGIARNSDDLVQILLALLGPSGARGHVPERCGLVELPDLLTRLSKVA